MISKSNFMNFLRHPAWLWIEKHNKSLIPPHDDNTQAVFDTGYLFETYAELRFPGAVRLGFEDYESYNSLTLRTQQALDDGVKTIFQGRFEFNDFTFICDVIDVIEEKTVDLYEIKSSTSAKPEHIFDLGFQTMVLEGCGFTVRNIAVIHVNNQYVRRGEVDADQLAAAKDVTEEVKSKLDIVREYAQLASSVANSSTMPDPSPSHVKLGALSSWMTIFRNIKELPEYSIYDLCSPGVKRIAELESRGIEKLVDIPDDIELTSKQRKQIEATKLDEPQIEKDNIKEFLDSFTYPLYFLDYETYSGLVPYFDGQRPYMQVPFQYSLHVLDTPDSEIRHLEYLHRDNSDPVKPLSDALKSHIGDSGTIITWNMGFEKSCNTTMGKLAPEFESFFIDVNERIVDLMIPFKNDWYVDKKCLGSASIKKVLPVLVPELTYADLNIHEGGSAQRLWMHAVLEGKRDDKDQILDDLIEYCKMDTLAMVRIYQELSRITA